MKTRPRTILAGLVAAVALGSLGWLEPIQRAAETSVGTEIAVRAGGDLQRAIDSARPGDVITLEAGAAFNGPFTLPEKSGDEWITIRSDAENRLPAPGSRVDPSQAALMPKLEASIGSVLTALPGAHHYRLVGIEIRPKPGVFLYNLVSLGASETASAQLPHDIAIERCYLHGDPARGARRGIALNSRETTVVDSHLSDFKENGADSQAIAGWNGAGPFRIENNRLEAAGENILFGGADPSIRDLVPSDIRILRNDVIKPLVWKAGEAGYQGTAWTVKNLLELKNARRVVVEGNRFEQNWVQAQNGFAILFTVRNQDGTAPWSVVEDVTFVNNVVRHTGSAVNILGHDDGAASGQTSRVTIRNNLFEDVGGERWGGDGRLFQVLDGAADVVIEHNTALQTGNLVTADGRPSNGFVFRDNIALNNAYGIVGSGAAPGSSTLAAFFPGAVVSRNVIVGADARAYPPDNFFPGRLDDVGFVSAQDGNYRLRDGSPYKRRASDGTDVGVDMDALGTIGGPQAPSPSPPPERQRPDGAAVTGSPRDPPRGFSFAALLFWGAVALLLYTHVGYPAVLLAWARLRPRRVARADITPDVSVLIVAHDEAARIGARLDNVLSLDYPSEKLEVVVGSDGSTDQTVDRARDYEARGVRVVGFAERRGKPSVLNDLVPSCRGEILVLGDARQRFGGDALRALVAPFADPEVGAVSGELMLEDERTGVGAGMGAYWRHEKLIRSAESRIGSMVGATGAIYAIRRELFSPLPSDTILDDVVLPVRIARRGRRVVFEPRAKAYDHAPRSSAQELARKVRTIAGNFQLFARESWLLSPLGNPIWLQAVSHKGLRLLTPALLGAALSANAALLSAGWPYRLLLAAQAAFYAAALGGYALRRVRPVALLSVPYALCLLAWATVVAAARSLGAGQTVTWTSADAAEGP